MPRSASTPGRKRKADEAMTNNDKAADSASKPKMTKAEKAALRERARLAMTKPSPAKAPKTTPTPKDTNPTPAKRRRTSTSAMLSNDAKAAAAAALSEEDGEDEKVEVKKSSSGAKLSARKEARLRAKEWGEKERAKQTATESTLRSSKKDDASADAAAGSKVSTSTTVPKSALQSASRPQRNSILQNNSSAMNPAALMSQASGGSVGQAAMANYFTTLKMQQQQQELLRAKELQQQQMATAQNAARMQQYAAMSQQQQPPQAQPPAEPHWQKQAAAKYPPVGTKANGSLIDDDEEDEDVAPPPPGDGAGLQYQISQQVLANFSASMQNQPVPYQAPPPEAYQYEGTGEEEEEDNDEEPIFRDDDDYISPARIHGYQPHTYYQQGQPQKSKTSIWFKLSIIVAVISVAIMMNKQWDIQWDMQSNSKSKQPCYLWNNGVNSCPDGVDTLACPDFALCKNGKLDACTSPYYEFSTESDECVPTPETKEIVTKLTTALETMVTEKLCSIGASMDNDEPIIFLYKEVSQQDPTLIETNPSEVFFKHVLKSEFIFDEAQKEIADSDNEEETTEPRYESEIYIGLPTSHPISLPLACRLASLYQSFLKMMGSFVVVLLLGALRFLWDSGSAYPLSSLGGLIVVLGVRKYRTYQAERQQLVRDVAAVREMVYDRLQDEATIGHVSLHIRDELTRTLYPFSQRQRAHMVQKVWPLVVPDIHLDNRVQKTTRIVEGGQVREVWKWVASTRKTPRRVHGTPSKRMG